MMRATLLVVTLGFAVACDRSGPDSGAEPTTPADGTPTAAATPAVTGSTEWPQTGPVNLQRERIADLTGDGTAETVVVTARGPAEDALEISIVIRTAGGDTLWVDGWQSAHYFKYDRLEGKSDADVQRTVRAQVDSLLADNRFSNRGLPQRLRGGGSSRDQLREAVRYHLAELDWRGRADLGPADPTPNEVHDRIEPQHVVIERVNVVLQELEQQPAFWYYAGGEEVQAIAWSVREHAFVRFYSCC
jgi:hypothetical protein